MKCIDGGYMNFQKACNTSNNLDNSNKCKTDVIVRYAQVMLWEINRYEKCSYCTISNHATATDSETTEWKAYTPQLLNAQFTDNYLI